ncbi:hypothetical protein PTTG_01812 [Puccinia triticina 1-1 BBBD Race 1]|uniref:HIT-type domain-containing protein n=1 Tax=Puccinia triticina (isolate 1-1 / race 1 (BBBD)) TaxID=630390 RepID=A0A180H0G3_PUCT1|nr:hypothetical protein PTTG_01812 [Puccinia triticina 1-1 BBBD Race 1]
MDLQLKPAGRRRRTRINQANQDTIKCLICQDSFARYTCPNCNLRYCSVECFKSQSHSTCSESFYKNALLEDIQLDGSADGGSQSQAAMLEMLRRIEAGGPLSDEDENGSDAESLELTADQLNRLSKDELLGFLTAEQIEEFNRKVSNGDLDPTFIQATINSQCQDPWWLDRQPDQSNPSSPSTVDLLDQSVLPALPDRLNPQLFYHVFSLTLGYVSLLRHYGLRSLFEATQEDRIDLLSQLPKFLPILFDSDLRLESITDCFGLFLKKLPNMGPESIPFLIKDLRYLFPDSQSKPKKALIVEVTTDGNPIPSRETWCSLALSDLYRFLNTHGWGYSHPKCNRKSILKKLLFFISFSIDSTRLNRFSQEIDNDESRLECDLRSDDNDDTLNPDQLPFSDLLVGNPSSNSYHSDLPRKPPKIIETSSTDNND